MKRTILALVASATLIASCDLSGSTEMSLYSYSQFEFDSSYFVDSLFLSQTFLGGSNSGTISFHNSPADGVSEMTGGLGLTRKHNRSLETLSDRPEYTMYAAAAGSSSNVAAVFYQNPDDSLMPEHDVYFYRADDGTCSPKSIEIANTQQTVYSVLKDTLGFLFTPGDYLKLTIKGLDASEAVTGTKEYYLADYRGGGEKIDSVLTDWQTLSLTGLGNIVYIDFELESNVEDFPMTFCIDNFVSYIYLCY